ncbi:hypothetical protein Tco_1490922 [Tanacetum coccineum]
MLAPKCATYNGRSTFANPKYLKKAQSDKPRLYEIPYDTSDPANRFCPDGEETVTLEKESRSKLDKDTVKPYNYTYQNSLYETFKPPSKTYLIRQQEIYAVAKSSDLRTRIDDPTGHRFQQTKDTLYLRNNALDLVLVEENLTYELIFKTIGLRWVPTGKIFAFSTNKVDSEPAHGSIVDIPHIHACKQTLGLSAGTSFNGQKQQRIDLNADALHNEKQENLRVCSSLGHQCQMVSAENNTSGPAPFLNVQKTFDRSRSSLGLHGNDVCSHQFRPRSSSMTSVHNRF